LRRPVIRFASNSRGILISIAESCSLLDGLTFPTSSLRRRSGKTVENVPLRQSSLAVLFTNYANRTSSGTKCPAAINTVLHQQWCLRFFQSAKHVAVELGQSSAHEAIAPCVPFPAPGAPIRTDDLWHKRFSIADANSDWVAQFQLS